MKLPAITAGPWELTEHRTSFGIKGRDGYSVATLTLGYKKETRFDEKLATAKAIKAVPTMLHTLALIREEVEKRQLPITSRVYDLADAALKAAGATE